MRRRGGAGEREPLVEDDVEALAQDDPDERLGRACVGCADGERCGTAGGSRDRPERRPGAAVVAGGRDEERAEVERPLRRPRLGPVGERSVRLDDAGDGDANGVVCVAVAVRVDRALEPGQQLVAACVDELAAVRGRLPAGDANREDRRSGRDAVQLVGATGARDDPGHLRAVTLELRRILWVRTRICVETAVDDVEAGQDLPAQVRVREVDTGVEQRDGDAAAVIAGQPGIRRCPLPCPNVVVESSRSERRGGERRANRIDAHDLRRLIEQGDRARVERGGEAVEHARVGEVGANEDAVDRERRQDFLLRRRGLRRTRSAPEPRSRNAPGRAADRRTAFGARRSIAGRSGSARVAADKPAPAGRRDRRGRLPPRAPIVAIRAAAVAAATMTSAKALRAGTRIERKVLGVRDGLA